MWYSITIVRGLIFTVLVLSALAILILIYSQGPAGACPIGTFQCGNSTSCVHQRFMCDGQIDCPNGEDETILKCVDWHGTPMNIFRRLQRKNSSKKCELKSYPQNCRCSAPTGLLCKDLNMKQLPNDIPRIINTLNVANNSLELTEKTFDKFSDLVFLHLGDNNLNMLPRRIFQNTSKLKVVFLLNNNLEIIEEGTFHGLKNMSWLIMKNCKLKKLNLGFWSDMEMIQWIDLSRNKLELHDDVFPRFEKLRILDLSINYIEEINENTFSQLMELRELNLKGNKIRFIDKMAYSNLHKLNDLDLSHNQIYYIDYNVFNSLCELNRLILGNNPLQELPVEAFSCMNNISSLDLQGIEIPNINVEMFSNLKSLEFVRFKKFYYCTYTPEAPKCEPNNDGVSSLDYLLMKPILRITLWVIGIFTCLANIFVLWGRNLAKDENKALSFVIKNLAASDLLIGIYLLVIGYYDNQYKGIYKQEAMNWMKSKTCTIIGIIAITSSEVSILILVFISVLRYIIIANPFRKFQNLNMKNACISMGAIWILGLIISLFPVLHWRSNTTFYGTNGLCFPLHIDDPFLLGWEYSAFIFIGINLSGLLIISVLYSGTYLSIMKTQKATTNSKNRINDDYEFSIRFFFIVVTDGACWLPIIFIKLLALLRVEISADIYAWIAVFVLPVNSSINPLLYTLTSPKYKSIFLKQNEYSKNEGRNKKKSLNGIESEFSAVSNTRLATNTSSVKNIALHI